MKSGLEKVLRPQSIAVIGGGSWCETVIRNSRKMGFQGPIWPVHPSKPRIGATETFATIAALPAPPDASFIGINRHATIDAVGQLSARGAGGAVCFASGFREAENESNEAAELQADLLDAAGGMTLIGPNCYGFINYLDGVLLWPDQHGGKRNASGVAIVTQSSNIAINITMQRRSLPVAYVVTAGNQAQTGLSEIGMALLSDPRVTALGLHIEGIDDIRALEALADLARSVGKSIVCIKVGRSEQARANAISHTASIAGSDAGAKALLNRLRIARVETLPEFLESLKLLHLCGPLASNRLASMSCSGGEASLIADMANDTALEFPPLDTSQKTRLRHALGPMVNLSNPLDYHTYIWPDVEAIAGTFSAMLSAHQGIALVIADFPREDRCDPTDWDAIISAMAIAGKSAPCPLAVVATLPENMPEEIAERFSSLGIVPFCGLHEALAAIQSGVFLGGKVETYAPVALANLPGNPITLDEAAAKSKLARHGLEIPLSNTVSDMASLAQTAAQMPFPLVFKGLGHAHKTEAGALALNLQSPAQVIDAAQAMDAQEFLLEEMITGVVAELLIGVVADTAHGFVLTIGAGGMLAELIDESISLLLPINETDIKLAIKQLKIHKILKGYRNQPAAAMEPIIKAVLSIQAFVLANQSRLAEVEINPLLCLPTRAVAADALIRIGK